MFRTLPAALALVLALLTVALRDPAVGTSTLRTSSSPHASSGNIHAFEFPEGAVPEQGASLAQKSFSIGKVTLQRPHQGPCGMALRGVLTAVFLVCVILAYGGVSGFSDSPMMAVAVEQPRRLAGAFMRSLSTDSAALKASHKAASRNVAALRGRALAHRLARLDEGEDGILDDDRDYAKIQGYLSRAEAYAQRQQFERAGKLFKKGTRMAEDWLVDLQSDSAGQVEIEEARLQLGDAFVRTANFFLERGQTLKAKKLLLRADNVLEGRMDTTSMRVQLLSANADRDSGKVVEAVTAYQLLLAKLSEGEEQASAPERALLEGLAAEAHADLARAMLSQDKASEALKILEETLDKLTASRASAPRVVSSSLVSHLNGLLGLAHLKNGNPEKAVETLDASLAGLGDVPAGLAGATAEVQEIMQTRAAAKAALGRSHSATEDLEVVRGLQEELLQTVNDGHNPGYAFGDGLVPDPRLWASLARTTTIASQLKLSAGHVDEALALARKALHLLREVKKTDGRVPKGCNLATFAEVKDLIAKVKNQKPAVAFLAAKTQQEKEEDEPEASDDEAIEKEAAMADEKLDSEDSVAKKGEDTIPKEALAKKE